MTGDESHRRKRGRVAGLDFEDWMTFKPDVNGTRELVGLRAG